MTPDNILLPDPANPGSMQVMVGSKVNKKTLAQIGEIQEKLDLGQWGSALELASSLMEQVPTLEELDPRLAQKSHFLLEQAKQQHETTRTRLKKSLKDLAALIGQQKFPEAETLLTTTRGEAVAAVITEIVTECDRLLPAIQKIKEFVNLFKTSNRCKLATLAKTLHLSREALINTLTEWGGILSGFKIDGDDIVFDSSADLSSFIMQLDEDFKNWEKSTAKQDEPPAKETGGNKELAKSDGTSIPNTITAPPSEGAKKLNGTPIPKKDPAPALPVDSRYKKVPNPPVKWDSPSIKAETVPRFQISTNIRDIVHPKDQPNLTGRPELTQDDKYQLVLQKGRFRAIKEEAETGASAKSLSMALNNLVTILTKNNPYIPVLPELVLEVDRLKKIGSKRLTAEELDIFRNKMNNWCSDL